MREPSWLEEEGAMPATPLSLQFEGISRHLANKAAAIAFDKEAPGQKTKCIAGITLPVSFRVPDKNALGCFVTFGRPAV